MSEPVKYRTIVADPPWPIRWAGGGTWRTNGRGVRYLNTKFKSHLPYATMTVEGIADLDVASVAAEDAHLYLWTTDRHAFDGSAMRVCEAWGFVPKRFLVWHKTGFGLGHFPRPQHELVLLGKRGRLPYRVNNVGSVQQWSFGYENGVRKHSRKPDGFLDLVEQASPGPYLELFARRQRMGWDVWGDEIASSVVILPSSAVPR